MPRSERTACSPSPKSPPTTPTTRTSAKLAPGESVVVHSAAGGVGSLAVQLAKPFGAGKVIASASSEQKRRLALELGADAAVDVRVDDLAGALIEANGGRALD